VLDLEGRVARLAAENRLLREELRERELEHSRDVAEIHRSYRREIVPMPRNELSRAHQDRKGR
jgi:MerR family transcriptional regulator/heat shock protein HspR